MGRLIPLETVMTTRATVVLKMHCSLCTSVRGSQSTGRLIRVQYSACINFVVECINFTAECTNFVQQSASQIGTQKFGGGLDGEMVNCRAIRPPVHYVQFVKYDVTVSFMAQVLDTVTYLVPQVLDTAS